MILIAELINHFVNGNVNMATVKKIKKAQSGVKATKDSSAYYKNEQMQNYESASKNMSSPKYSESAFKRAAQSGKDLDRQKLKGKPGYDANGFAKKKAMKSGGMLKRADGSYSKRGLWDNIRANKGSGKKPTAQMLKQEKKIKSKTK